MPSASKNIFWLTFSRTVALVLLFLAYTQLFRYLGPRGTGQHQFVLSYTFIFAVVVDFGIQQYIIKKISESPGEVKRYFQNFFAIEVVLAFLVYAAMLVVAKFNNYEPVVFAAIAVSGAGLFINALTYPFLSVMTALQDLKKVAFLNFLQSAVNITIIFLTIALHKYIVFLVSNQILFGIINLVLYYRFIKKYIPRPGLMEALGALDWRLVKSLLLAALPFALLVGFSTIYNRIDVIIITRLRGYVDAGLYTAAYKFFDLVSFFPAVVSLTLYPVFSSLLAQHQVGSARDMFEKYLRFMIALALPMGVGGSLLAVPLIKFVAGQEFISAGPVLAILVWAPAVLFIYVTANSIIISQQTRLAVIVTGANMALNIIGNLILIPRIGIKGAAIMTVVSESIQGLFYFYLVFKKVLPFSFFIWLWRPLLASAIMGLAVWATRDLFLPIPLSFGAGVYALTLLILNFFRAGDWEFFKNFFKKSESSPTAIPLANK